MITKKEEKKKIKIIKNGINELEFYLTTFRCCLHWWKKVVVKFGDDLIFDRGQVGDHFFDICHLEK